MASIEEDWKLHWDVGGAAHYITSRGYKTIALQFPDELLQEASAVSRALQDACAAQGLEVQVPEDMLTSEVLHSDFSPGILTVSMPSLSVCVCVSST